MSMSQAVHVQGRGEAATHSHAPTLEVELSSKRLSSVTSTHPRAARAG